VKSEVFVARIIVLMLCQLAPSNRCSTVGAECQGNEFLKKVARANSFQLTLHLIHVMTCREYLHCHEKVDDLKK